MILGEKFKYFHILYFWRKNSNDKWLTSLSNFGFLSCQTEIRKGQFSRMNPCDIRKRAKTKYS